MLFKFSSKEFFQSRTLFLFVFAVLAFGIWLFPADTLIKAQSGGFMVVGVSVSPGRINSGNSVIVSWSSTLYNTAAELDPARCSVYSNIPGVGANDIYGNTTVYPSNTTTYNVSVSCTVDEYPYGPDMPVPTNYSNSGSARVGVGFTTISAANQSDWVPRGGPGTCDKCKPYFCPADHPIVCGLKSDPVEGSLLNTLMCCALSPQAQSLGTGLSGGYDKIDATALGGGMWCPKINQVLVGGEWSKNNQLDYGYCQELTGPIEIDQSYNAYNTSVYAGQFLTCANDALVYGGKNGDGANDSWHGRYCATTFYSGYVPPPPTCTIDASLSCDNNALLTWSTSNCSSRSISTIGPVGASGSTQGVAGTSYTLTADGQTSYASCPAKPLPTASLTVNNQHAHSGNPITLNVGQYPNYAWLSTGSGNSYTSSWAVSPTDGCGWGGLTGTPWIINDTNGASGSRNTDQIQACQAGRTFTLSYTATNSSGAASDSIVITIPATVVCSGGYTQGQQKSCPGQNVACVGKQTCQSNGTWSACDYSATDWNSSCDDGNSCTSNTSCDNIGVCGNLGTGHGVNNPVNATLSGWSNSGFCNVVAGTCGGTQHQTRTCSGNSCGGDATCGGQALSQDISCTASNGTSCNDSNACSSGETCQSGTCQGGSAPSGSHCQGQSCVANTTSSCAPSCTTNGDCGGCVANAGASCNDGNACTTGETIQCNGTCSGGSAPSGSHCQSTTCVANTTSACSPSCTTNQDCGSCTTLTFRSSTSGFSTSSSGPAASSLTVSPGQNFYAFVDYGQINDAVILPNVSGSYTCADSGAWLGTARRFNCTAPASVNSYSYTTGTNGGTSSNICVGTANIGTLSVGTTPKPHIVLNPTTFSFSGVSGGSTPSGQTLNISNTGTAALNWSGSTNQTWCHISTASGSIGAGGNNNITVTVDSPSNVGSFSCTITISDPNADNSPTANVTYTVSPSGAPTCGSAAPQSLTTTATSGTFYAYAYGVQNATVVNFPTWGDTGGQDDLVWYPGTNQGGGTWRASINLANHKLGNPEYGIFRVHVYMNNNSYSDVKCGEANFSRNAPKPHIVLNPTTIPFSGVSGGSTPAGQTLNIANTGTATLNWTGSTNQTWCHISSASGSIGAGGNSNITVTVDSPSNVGSFNCTIAISDPNADNSPTANVTYTVTPGSCPVGSVSLSSSTIIVGQTSTASAPANFSGGSFQSSNSGIASVSGSIVTGQSAGSATISGTGWTYVINGATSCSLAGSILTVNPNSFPLNVSKAGTGSGTVTSAPAGINCGGSCSANYTSGISVVLSASASGGSTFAGWSGEGCSGTGTCTVSMTQARNVTATFNLTTGSCVGAGSGTGLTGNYYDGINFNTFVTTKIDSTVNFDPADSLGNFANSPDGDTFSIRWEGDVQATCSETYTFYTRTDDGVRLWVNSQLLIDHWVPQGPTEYSNTIALTAGQKYSIKMEFYEDGGGAAAQLSWFSASTVKAIIPQAQLYPNSFSLLVSKAGSGNGTVTSNPAGINCGATCSASYNSGTSVVLSASASGGSTFAGWSGEGCSGTGTCTVSMTQARNVTATFNNSPPPPPDGPPTASNSSMDATVNCGQVKLAWTDQSNNETGFKVYRNSINDALTATLITTTAANTTSYTYTAPDTNAYYYFVSADKSGSESTRVAASNNPVSAIACLANLGDSDKDIASVNGTAINGNSACNSSTDALPTTVSLKIGDTLGFRINLCNDQGEAVATGITVTDTMVNLQMPTAGWGAQYCLGATCTSVTPAVSGTAPNQTLTFNLTNSSFNIPQNGGAKLTFTAQLTVPSGTTATQSRFQNSFRASYSGTQNVNRSTPWLLFYTGKGVPSIIEVP